MADELMPCECGRCQFEPCTGELNRDGLHGHRVYCASCPASTIWHPTAEAAIAAWNRRAPAVAVTREEVARVIRDAMRGVRGIAAPATPDEVTDALMALLRERGATPPAVAGKEGGG